MSKSEWFTKTGVMPNELDSVKHRRQHGSSSQKFPKQPDDIYWEADDMGIKEEANYSTEPPAERIRLVRLSVDNFPKRKAGLERALELAVKLHGPCTFHDSYTTARFHCYRFVVPYEG